MLKLFKKYKLWFTRRHEWCKIQTEIGRMVLLNPGSELPLWGKEYHETWRHPQTGFIVHRTMVG